MKKSIIIIIAICLFSVNVFSQDGTNAAATLEKISTKYKKYKTSKLEVKLVIDVPETEVDVIRNGTAWLKGDMFKIDFDEKILVSNIKTQWTYLKEVNELQISDYDPSSMIFLPSKIFNLYSDDYKYMVQKEFKNSKGELIQKIELSPSDKDQQIFKIVATINVNLMKIVKTQMFEKNGFKYTYEILNFEPNIALDDNFFIFNPKEYNIEEDDITDLR